MHVQLHLGRFSDPLHASRSSTSETSALLGSERGKGALRPLTKHERFAPPGAPGRFSAGKRQEAAKVQVALQQPRLHPRFLTSFFVCEPYLSQFLDSHPGNMPKVNIIPGYRGGTCHVVF